MVDLVQIGELASRVFAVVTIAAVVTAVVWVLRSSRHDRNRPSFLLHESEVDGATALVFGTRGGDFVRSGIAYEIRWGDAAPTIDLVANPRFGGSVLDRATGMDMPITSRDHPFVGSSVDALGHLGLRAVRTDASLLDEWLTLDRVSALTAIDAELVAPHRQDRRLEVSDTHVRLTVYADDLAPPMTTTLAHLSALSEPLRTTSAVPSAPSQATPPTGTLKRTGFGE